MYIVADIGGTKTRIAGSRDLETFGEPVIFHTAMEYQRDIAMMIERIRGILGSEKLERMMAGIPGVIGPERNLLKMPNIPSWSGQPFVHDIEAAFGGRVELVNDTAMCGMGEAHSGAGRGTHVLMYLTVSTGVGGVRIVDGLLNAPERSAEIGHQYITEDLKEWSKCISGKAIKKRFGIDPRELGKDHPVWEELARTTAIGVHNSILHWTPERVVLGGSMFNDIGISVERVAAHLKEIMTSFPDIPELVHSQLGDVGGLWGGLALLKQQKI